MQKVGELEGAHEMPIRNVDLSPANDYQILTCGDDCVIRQWDSRYAIIFCSNLYLEYKARINNILQYHPRFLCSGGNIIEYKLLGLRFTVRCKR